MNKYYYELQIKPSSHYLLYLDLIESLVASAIEEFNGSIIIRSEDTLEEIKEGVELFTQKLCKALKTNIKCEIIYDKKENKDWIAEYQKSVAPIEVGKFYIHPNWCEPKEKSLNIKIDPALTFGSGHHETTNTCLQFIEKYVDKNDLVLDVGCGSGILSIASAKLGAVVDICDTDIVAVEDSLKNFKANDVICNDSWEGSSNLTLKTYDVVIANIVADVLCMIHKDLKKVAKKGALIILSGIMKQHKNKVMKKFDDCILVEEIQKNEWVTLIVKKDKIINK